MRILVDSLAFPAVQAVVRQEQAVVDEERVYGDQHDVVEENGGFKVERFAVLHQLRSGVLDYVQVNKHTEQHLPRTAIHERVFGDPRVAVLEPDIVVVEAHGVHGFVEDR